MANRRPLVTTGTVLGFRPQAAAPVLPLAIHRQGARVLGEVDIGEVRPAGVAGGRSIGPVWTGKCQGQGDNDVGLRGAWVNQRVMAVLWVMTAQHPTR